MYKTIVKSSFDPLSLSKFYEDLSLPVLDIEFWCSIWDPFCFTI